MRMYIILSYIKLSFWVTFLLYYTTLFQSLHSHLPSRTLRSDLHDDDHLLVLLVYMVPRSPHFTSRFSRLDKEHLRPQTIGMFLESTSQPVIHDLLFDMRGCAARSDHLIFVSSHFSARQREQETDQKATRHDLLGRTQEDSDGTASQI